MHSWAEAIHTGKILMQMTKAGVNIYKVQITQASVATLSAEGHYSSVRLTHSNELQDDSSS